MFLSTLAANFIVICSLNNFNKLPSTIEGRVTLATRNYYHISVENKDKTQKVALVIEKKHCKEK